MQALDLPILMRHFEMPVRMAGALRTFLSCLVRVCPYLCIWSFMLSLSLLIVCVVFPALHVLCWSFFYRWRILIVLHVLEIKSL